MGNPVSAKSALDIARTATNEAMTQTAATLATWDRGIGILTSILISGVSWRWYATGYVVPAGSTSVAVTATGGGVWVQDSLSDAFGRRANVKADGASDDTAAIRAAMVAVSALSGYTVLLPAGDIKVLNLVPVPGVRLKGAYGGKTRLIGIGATGTLIDMSAGGWLEDLILVSGGVGQMAIMHQTTGAYQRDIVRRVRMEGFTGSRALQSTLADGLLLDNVEAQDCYIPIHILTPKGSVDIVKPRIINAQTATMSIGILVNTPTASAIVTGATVRIVQPYIRGANLDPTGYSAESWGIAATRVLNVEVTNPDIQGCEAPAYTFVAGSGKNPAGPATGGGILMGSRSFGWRITGGDVLNNRVNVYVEEQPEAGAAGTQVQAGSDLGGVMQGTHIAFARGPGISFSYGVTAMLKNCRIHDNGEDGAVADSDFVDFIGNTVYNNWKNRAAPPVQLVRAGIRTIGRFNKIADNTLYDTQSTPTQDYDIAIGENRGHRVSSNTGRYGNGAASIYEGTDYSSDGLTPNLFLDVDTNGLNAGYLGTLVQANNPATALYYPIGFLPISSAGDVSKIIVDVQGGAYDAGSVALDRFFFGSQGAFNSLFVPSGSATAAAARANLSVVVYQNADSTFTVYGKTKAGGYIHGNVRAFLVPASASTTSFRARTRPLALGKGVATVPAGTLVFDGSDPAYMPAASAGAGAGAASVPLGGVVQQNNPAAPQFYPVVTLPNGTATQNKLVIEVFGSDYNASVGLRSLRAVMSAFGGFSYLYDTVGPGSVATGVTAYTQTDGTVQVFIKVATASFTHGAARAYWQTGSGAAPVALTIGAATGTVPAGTLVLDTNDLVNFPPNAVHGVGQVAFALGSAAAGVPINTLFKDAADGKLKFKDSGSVVTGMGAAPTFVTIAGSDFNILVTGTTALGTPPALATGVVITISGGDVYATITGTAPTTASPPFADTTQIQVAPLADAQAFRAIIKTGAPRLIGYWLKAGS